jgi:hypothetical protein
VWAERSGPRTSIPNEKLEMPDSLTEFGVCFRSEQLELREFRDLGVQLGGNKSSGSS